MVWEMATPYLGGFYDIPMLNRGISTDCNQWKWEVSRSRPTWSIMWGVPSRIRVGWPCTPQGAFSPKGGAHDCCSWPGSPTEAVAEQYFCRSCAYIPHVCGKGHWWMHWYATQIPGFTESLSICHYTHSGQSKPTSHNSKISVNNTDVLGSEYAVPGIGTSCPAKSKPSSTYLDTEYRFWWLS